MFKTYRDQGFTVVGIALDAEGIAPAKRYYKKHGVTFPSLVDADYATGFGAVPKTFFINELGVVQPLRGWRERLKKNEKLQTVTPAIRKQWSQPGERTNAAGIARLLAAHRKNPADLASATELASRYLALKLNDDAAKVLKSAIGRYDAKRVARGKNAEKNRLLGQAYFQLSRATTDNRKRRVEYATLSFYLNPSIGFGKQIARIIAPEKFDGRKDGRFDNRFREATLRRLRRERAEWLKK